MHLIVNYIFIGFFIGCHVATVGQRNQLISSWNNNGMGCDVVAMFGVKVVVCWVLSY